MTNTLNSSMYIGLTDILDDSKIDPEIDVKRLENKMGKPSLNLEKIDDEPEVKDPMSDFKNDIARLSATIGIDLSDDGDESAQSTPVSSPVGAKMSSARLGSPVMRSSPMMKSSPRLNIAPATKYRIADDYEESAPRNGGGQRRYNSMNNITKEQEKYHQIEEVTRMIGGDNFTTSGVTFDDERREEARLLMIEEIKTLVEEITDEGGDASLYKNLESLPYERLEILKRIATARATKNKYCNLADEIILMGTGFLEEIFDGNRIWFKKYRPDLRGWSTSVNARLRKLRPETSRFVSETINTASLNLPMRLAVELVPNAIMFARMNKNHSKESGITAAELSQANNRLRDI